MVSLQPNSRIRPVAGIASHPSVQTTAQPLATVTALAPLRVARQSFVPPSAFAAKLPLAQLIDEAMPDPGVVVEMRRDGPLYTMVATANLTRDTFQIYQARHRDGPWERAKDAMGRPKSVFPANERPDWIDTNEPDRWAPELHKVDDRWLCVYTARHRDGDLRVAVAVADDVTGPYRDLGPVLTAPHGVIDATVVRDRKSGKWTMVYKNDDNSVHQPTPIIARTFTLGDDALRWTSKPHEIARSGEGHGGLLEAPWLVHENGTTWCVLSSDYYGGADYKMWIGSIDDVMKGEIDDLRHLMTTDSPCLRGKWIGPGHCSLVKEAKGIYSMYFHAWPEGSEVQASMVDDPQVREERWRHRFDYSEHRMVLRATLAFIDERGKPCKPYIVEDRLK